MMHIKHSMVRQLVVIVLVVGVVLIPMQSAVAQWARVPEPKRVINDRDADDRAPVPDPTILSETKKAAATLSEKSDAGVARPADVAALRANLSILFHHADAIKLTAWHEQALRSRPEITKAFLDRPLIVGRLGYGSTYAEKLTVTEFVRQRGVRALQEKVLDELQGVVDQDFISGNFRSVRFPPVPWIEPSVCHDLSNIQTELDYMAVFGAVGGYIVVATLGAPSFAVWRFRVHFC